MDVRLRLGPGARWVAEYYETSGETELEGGGLEVVLPAARLEWLERLALRLGSEVQVVEPTDLEARVRELAARTLERYA